MMVNRQFHEVFGTTDREVIGRKELNVHQDEESAHKFTAVDEEVKNERVHKLIALSDQLAKEYAARFENEVLEVIPEEPFGEGGEGGEGLYSGYTDNYLKVVFPATEDMVGKIVKVKITKAGYPYNEGQFVRVLEPVHA